MINLPLHFYKEDLLVPTRAQFEQLRRSGRLELPPGADKPPLGDYVLVTSMENDEEESPIDGFYGNEPGKLAFYLQNTWLARVETQQPTRLALDVWQTLRKRLLGILPPPSVQVPSLDWKAFKRLVHSLDCKMTFSLQERVTQTGSFLGQVGVCTCGEDGCASTYVWMERGILLAVFHTSAMNLDRVYLAPLDP